MAACQLTSAHHGFDYMVLMKLPPEQKIGTSVPL